MVSWGARWGAPSNEPILGIPLLLQRSVLPGQNPWDRRDRLTWVPRLMALVGYSPFANLTGAEVSQKKSNWNKSDNDVNSLTIAQLQGANLRYAEASGAFFAGANLSGADMSGSNLMDADLRHASLSFAKLGGADLDGAHMGGADLLRVNLRGTRLESAGLSGTALFRADLSGADLSHADLGGANLQEVQLGGANLEAADLRGAYLGGADLSYAYLFRAVLTYTDFRDSGNLDLETVKGAINWEKAFYDDDTLKALGLRPDHNVKLAEQQKKEQELQQKQITGQAATKPAASKQN
jgi:uncharacterized protein YjbI with pentapeptide repeats